MDATELNPTMKNRLPLLLISYLLDECLVYPRAIPSRNFSSHADIGKVLKPGSVAYDPATGEYRIAGGGANMWGASDAFHFVWKETSGNFALTADVHWPGTNGNPHRKACLVIRQSLNLGFGLCGCRAARRRTDVASIPGNNRRPDA